MIQVGCIELRITLVIIRLNSVISISNQSFLLLVVLCAVDYFGPFPLFNKGLKAQLKASSFNLTRARIELEEGFAKGVIYGRFNFGSGELHKLGKKYPVRRAKFKPSSFLLIRLFF